MHFQGRVCLSREDNYDVRYGGSCIHRAVLLSEIQAALVYYNLYNLLDWTFLKLCPPSHAAALLSFCRLSSLSLILLSCASSTTRREHLSRAIKLQVSGLLPEHVSWKKNHQGWWILGCMDVCQHHSTAVLADLLWNTD